MRAAFITTQNNQFGGAFATSYYQNGGPSPVAIIVLPLRPEQSWPWWSKGYVAWKILGITGIATMARVKSSLLLTRSEREQGLHKDWLRTLAREPAAVSAVTDINGKQAERLLRQLDLDLLVSIGAPQIINPRVVKLAKLGGINVHNGRLPRFRGHFGTFWEVASGEHDSYISIHQLARQVDSGVLAAVAHVPISQSTSMVELLIQKKVIGGALLARVMLEARVKGGLPVLGSSANNDDCAGGYYGWPTLRDIAAFKWPRPAA